MRTFLKILFQYFLMLSLISCGEEKINHQFEPEIPEDNSTEPKEPAKPEQQEPQSGSLINCSYIRGDFYELGNISSESMNACTDLIYLEARPYSNGDITFDLPHNDGIYGDAAVYTEEFKGRKGVLHFNGSGKMNCGEGLLDSPRYEQTKGYNQFSIGTYIYIDEWTTDATLFEKGNQGPFISLRLGNKEGNLKLILNNFESIASFDNTELRPGDWYHLTFTFNTATEKKDFKLYVNEKVYNANFTKPYNDSFFKNARGNFYLGGTEGKNERNFKGYLDETYISGLDTHGNLGKTPIQFDNWNSTKVLTYWKYDDKENPGRDYHSWLTRLAKIRQDIAGNQNVHLRLGISGGKSNFWKEMAANSSARNNFARKIKDLLEKHRFAGVDLDLEWAYSAQEFLNYSAVIVKLREFLNKDYILSASLHPISYAISKEAIDALDIISLQCYGPQPKWLPYEQFVKCGKDVVAYGIPKDKLLMGVPFYGTSGQQIEAYRTFFPYITSISENSVIYKGKTFQFDNITRMQQKIKHICTEGYRGVMSWDLATDLKYTHESSLLRCVNETIRNHFNKK